MVNEYMLHDLFQSLEQRVLLGADPFDTAAAVLLHFSADNADRLGTIVALDRDVIETPGDTDLFRFISPVDADSVHVSVGAAFERTTLAAAFGLYKRSEPAGKIVLIDELITEPGGVGAVFKSIDPGAIAEGDELFILAHAGPLSDVADSHTGAYRVTIVLGFDTSKYDFSAGVPDPDPQSPHDMPRDDHPNAPAEFWREEAWHANADDADGPHDHHGVPARGGVAGGTEILLSPLDGVGAHTGRIDEARDTDLFRFTATADGITTVTITPDIGLDAEVFVLDVHGAVITVAFSDESGTPIDVTFAVEKGRVYGVLVAPIDDAHSHGLGHVIADGNGHDCSHGEGHDHTTTGAYTLDVATDQDTYHLYYPEGYSSPDIEEFVPIVNPNDHDVSYTIIARYEWGERDEILETGTIAANSRGGATISTRGDDAISLTREGVPYAIEIIADGPISATLSHYDFGVTTGENFTARVSDTWSLPVVHKDDAVYRDYVVFYNPSDADAEITLTLIAEDGTMTQLSRTVGALRRGGIDINGDADLAGLGRFGVLVQADTPIIAAVSSYNIADMSGFGVLGGAGDSTNTGVIPLVDPQETVITLFNANLAAAQVELTWLSAGTPESLVITVDPLSTYVVNPADAALTTTLTSTLAYAANLPVSVMAERTLHTDAEGVTAASTAATGYLFGDAFLNTELAGDQYFETLAVANTTDADASVTITLLFVDGTSTDIDLVVAGRSVGLIELHELDELLDREDPLVWYSILVTADTAIIASFSHFDGFLNGGWATLGTPFGGLVEL